MKVRDDGATRKLKVISIHVDMYVCTKFRGDLSNSHWDDSLQTTNVNLKVLLEEKSKIIPWGPWISVQTFMPIHQVDMTIFH